jgi:hypothetical protein
LRGRLPPSPRGRLTQCPRAGVSHQVRAGVSYRVRAGVSYQVRAGASPNAPARASPTKSAQASLTKSARAPHPMPPRGRLTNPARACPLTKTPARPTWALMENARAGASYQVLARAPLQPRAGVSHQVRARAPLTKDHLSARAPLLYRSLRAGVLSPPRSWTLDLAVWPPPHPAPPRPRGRLAPNPGRRSSPRLPRPLRPPRHWSILPVPRGPRGDAASES